MWIFSMLSMLSVLSVLSVHATTKYDESLAKIAINLSQASYCVSSVWTCATCDTANTLEAVVESHGERALVGYNTNIDSLFVAFRGSTNIQNWLDNIQFRKIYPYNDTSIGVEKGFYKAYENIRSEVMDALDAARQKYTTNHLLLTGHSLGAAITTLMAFDMAVATTVATTVDVVKENMYSLTVYTFGSPRIGNAPFVQSFSKCVTSNSRVTHYYDMVPHLPQEALGFLHVPYETWYNEDNTMYTTCTDDVDHEDDACSDSCAPVHCTSTSDHLNYLGIPMGSTNGLC